MNDLTLPPFQPKPGPGRPDPVQFVRTEPLPGSSPWQVQRHTGLGACYRTEHPALEALAPLLHRLNTTLTHCLGESGSARGLGDFLVWWARRNGAATLSPQAKLPDLRDFTRYLQARVDALNQDALNQDRPRPADPDAAHGDSDTARMDSDGVAADALLERLGPDLAARPVRVVCCWKCGEVRLVLDGRVSVSEARRVWGDARFFWAKASGVSCGC